MSEERTPRSRPIRFADTSGSGGFQRARRVGVRRSWNVIAKAQQPHQPVEPPAGWCRMRGRPSSKVTHSRRRNSGARISLAAFALQPSAQALRKVVRSIAIVLAALRVLPRLIPAQPTTYHPSVMASERSRGYRAIKASTIADVAFDTPLTELVRSRASRRSFPALLVDR